MTNSTAALLNQCGDVIAEVTNAPAGNTIEITGGFTADGDPVNVQTYKISRSKKNLEIAGEIEANGSNYVSKVGEAFVLRSWADNS
jgi:hypothetical protein